MILGENPEKFIKKFLVASPAQAFLLVGGDEKLEKFLVDLLSGGAKTSFDVKIYESESLRIEEAREIHKAANESALSDTKVFLIKVGYLAPEAQATLLKTLEEPHPKTYFIFSLLSEAVLLAPLLSRLTVFRTRISPGISPEELKFSLENVAFVAKERSSTEELFRKLETWLEAKLQSVPADKFSSLGDFLEDLLRLKKRFFEKTYSNRMLLEHLAVSKFYLNE